MRVDQLDMSASRVPPLSRGRMTLGITLAVILGALVVTSPKWVEDVGPDEIAVIQSPVAGTLTWYTTPGLKYQGWGDVTKYKKRATYSFDTQGVDSQKVATGGIVVRFNDGGHGTMYGSIQFELPLIEEKLNAIHSKYRTQDALQHEIVETMTNKAVYLVGTLMSSKESYAEKRNDLIHYVTDQVQNGVYRTRQKTAWVKDETTKEETKQVTMAEIVMKDGQPERQEESILNRYGIQASNFTIVRMPYDEVVEKQIRQQQQIAMDVQTSIADSKKAEQRAQTVEAQGRADAAEAKWKQEVLKAQAVTKAEQEKLVNVTNFQRDRETALIQADQQKQTAELQAQQRLEVAKLDKQAAEQKKAQDILLGEGEAKRKELVLQADGALAQKLDALQNIAKVNAEALQNYKGNIVPGVMWIGNSGPGGAQVTNGFNDYLSVLTMKAVKDLGVDLSLSAQPLPVLQTQPAARAKVN